MEPDKRDYLIQEIRQWRRSKLLPEHYCDFLLNLYAAEPEEKTASWHGLTPAELRGMKGTSWFAIIGLIGIICYLGFHFTSFSQPMQTILLLAGSAIGLAFGYRFRARKSVLARIGFGLGALLVLYAGLDYLQAQGASAWVVAGFTAVCAVGWMLLGLMSGIGLFHFAGWVVLLLVYGWLLYRYIPAFNWPLTQMAWLPPSAVMLWSGWLLHHKNRAPAGVLFFIGVLLWFAPELFGMLLPEVRGGIVQASFLVKLAAAGVVLFAFRKKWTEWVA
ncbi:hypothetical protein J31TS4_29060 [Paenibacillus sp. J31TS4]|uniref:hypothetical protein n=1 Tax=Paenibacillus sp. J31TS4 TaxID=2807195 RepID=UPI001B27E302|nr:hypothetical protein [Paenibacillus sp. J31TS4]GIP39626.1 hypothetical protein J31TS4_29060 [Paenibacillus sp. J31TS4]